MASPDKMSATSQDQPKKSTSIFFEKLGQKFSTIKDDIADNIERRKQSYNSHNQVHFTRSNQSEESLVIEKKPPTPTEVLQQHPSGKE
jgi:23S rRNA maturation-related 3'-5' exoribonuclease YhaM